MAAETDSPARSARWAAERRQPAWLGLFGNTAVSLAASGLAVGVLIFAQVISNANVAAAALTIVAVSGIIGVAAGAAAWVHTALAGRVDILSQALDASPDAQLILAPNGRIAHANTAFDDLFPQSDQPALARIAAALSGA